MKTLLTLVFLFTASLEAQDSLKTIVSVFYFGGSDCPFCIDSTNIRNINLMRAKMPEVHPNATLKFILVVMDEDLERGIRFMKHYPDWDEVSIGKFYHNELMLEHVNRSELPAVPHIRVYRDAIAAGRFNIPVLEQRTLLVDLVGEKQIGSWISDGYPLSK